MPIELCRHNGARGRSRRRGAPACVGAAVYFLAILAAGLQTTAAATASTESDAQILAEINSRVLDAHAGYFTGIRIDIVRGDILLTGRVEKPQYKTRAAALVRSVRGVGSVLNEIRTGKPLSLSHRADEARIENRIAIALHRAFRTTLPTVTWRVAEGTTYIFGETSSQWAHARVFATVKRVKGVERIVDHLRIALTTEKR